MTRNLKRRYNEINNVAGSIEDLAPIDQKLEKERREDQGEEHRVRGVWAVRG